jgi:hypothetical protein
LGQFVIQVAHYGVCIKWWDMQTSQLQCMQHKITKSKK